MKLITIEEPQKTILEPVNEAAEQDEPLSEEPAKVESKKEEGKVTRIRTRSRVETAL